MVSHSAGARGSFRYHCDFGRGRHIFVGGTHQPVCTSVSRCEGVFGMRAVHELMLSSPLGKLAPGNAEIDKAFKDMWAEAENNRNKWSCESHHRPLFSLALLRLILINLVSIQTWGEPPHYLIYRTVKGLRPSGFHTGRILRVCRHSQLRLPTAWARMPTLRRNSRTWESCTRPIIHQRVPGKPFTIMCPLLDWVSQVINQS